MSFQSPEQDLSSSETRALNQEFPVFKKDVAGVKPNKFHLSTKFIPDFDIRFVTYSEFGVDKTEALTPTTPQEGYQITEADFDLKSRSEKQSFLKGNKIDPHLASLSLEAWGDVEKDTEDSFFSIVQPETGDESGVYKFRPEVLQELRNLCLIITFPESTYVSVIDDEFLEGGQITFDSFYPLDTPPLASGNFEERNFNIPTIGLRDGLKIILPNDDKLIQIRGRFIKVLRKNKKD